ncbi:hypothetical protein [Psychrobacter sp. JCM 18903]|uniref:hypothetical protein n=1 Tax=Psychrobacter sp. JCM 18903 TaxID=1298610 RepID=UPI0005F062E8|nr:hypothetical protein [Psychrobacter sp. JCM 18903]
MNNIAVFGDISANGIDGSSIWMQSVCNLFSSAGHDVYLILRDRPTDNTITNGIDIRVNIINPWDQSYTEIGSENTISPYELYSILNAIDKKIHFDNIIMRAPRFVKDMYRNIANLSYKKIISKMDIYFAALSVFEDSYELTILNNVHSSINRLVVQTEQMRDYAEQMFPELVERVIVLNPMVPKIIYQDSKAIKNKIKNKSVVYAGKLDVNYLIEDYIDNSLSISELGYKVKLIGSKFNTVKDDKGFKNRLESKIKEKGIQWTKVLGRNETINETSKSTFLISIRDKKFDTNNEISTKLLESISAGTLPIINKSRANMSIVGDNYPLFADSYSELYSIIGAFSLTTSNYKKILNIAQNKVEAYTFKYIYDKQLKFFYEGYNTNKLKNIKEVSRKVLIASHDNKFLSKVIKELEGISGLVIKFDNWSSTLKNDKKYSERMVEWADIIICEWAVGPAVFYSQNKKANQRLLIRLHRFEITTNQPSLINADNVDYFIVVSDYIKDFCIRNYKWESEKIKVLPQYADTLHFNREKIQGYEYNLGLLGCIPRLKRLDRSLDILEELRKTDDRYVLYIKSKMPWDVPFIWNKSEEREFYFSQLERIENSEWLKDAVIFDDYGNDVSVWFRKIGWLLSTSDTEGCHTAVAEAMSSGSKSVIFDWPGSDNVYKLNEIFSSSQQASKHILHNNYFEEASIALQKSYCFNNFDISKTINFYFEFIFSHQ